MRARNIKPSFFIDCDLSEVDFASRLLFIGLWCYADREGRFEWKPKQIKASIFPYDKVDIDKLLRNLISLHVITCHEGVGYVENFKKHQHPHPHEAKSTLPEKHQLNQCHDMPLDVTECQDDVMIIDSLIPDVRTPDSLIPDSNLKPLSEYSDDFLKFWSVYPEKTGKGAAWKAWKKTRPPIDSVVDALLWQRDSQKWKEGFIPNPSTYINQRRWEDEPPQTGVTISASPGAARSLAIAAKLKAERLAREAAHEI